MRRSYAVLVVAFLIAAQCTAQSTMAQTAEEPKHTAQVYGFWGVGGLFGGGGSSAASQIGGGGEGTVYKGLGVSFDLGYLYPLREFGAGFGTLSPGVQYQFTPHRKTVPFVSGGYTLGFREGAMNMVHFGAGTTYWFNERIGLRIEARDHMPTAGTGYHYFLVRVGIAGH